MWEVAWFLDLNIPLLLPTLLPVFPLSSALSKVWKIQVFRLQRDLLVVTPQKGSVNSSLIVLVKLNKHWFKKETRVSFFCTWDGSKLWLSCCVVSHSNFSDSFYVYKGIQAQKDLHIQLTHPVRSCEWLGGTPSVHQLYLVSVFCLGVGVWASPLPPGALLWSPCWAGLCCKSVHLGTQLCSRACSRPAWCRANVIIRKGEEDFPGSCETILFC